MSAVLSDEECEEILRFINAKQWTYAKQGVEHPRLAAIEEAKNLGMDTHQAMSYAGKRSGKNTKKRKNKSAINGHISERRGGMNSSYPREILMTYISRDQIIPNDETLIELFPKAAGIQYTKSAFRTQISYLRSLGYEFELHEDNSRKCIRKPPKPLPNIDIKNPPPPPVVPKSSTEEPEKCNILDVLLRIERILLDLKVGQIRNERIDIRMEQILWGLFSVWDTEQLGIARIDDLRWILVQEVKPEIGKEVLLGWEWDETLDIGHWDGEVFRNGMNEIILTPPLCWSELPEGPTLKDKKGRKP